MQRAGWAGPVCSVPASKQASEGLKEAPAQPALCCKLCPYLDNKSGLFPYTSHPEGIGAKENQWQEREWEDATHSRTHKTAICLHRNEALVWKAGQKQLFPNTFLRQCLGGERMTRRQTLHSYPQREAHWKTRAAQKPFPAPTANPELARNTMSVSWAKHSHAEQAHRVVPLQQHQQRQPGAEAPSHQQQHAGSCWALPLVFPAGLYRGGRPLTLPRWMHSFRLCGARRRGQVLPSSSLCSQGLVRPCNTGTIETSQH